PLLQQAHVYGIFQQGLTGSLERKRARINVRGVPAHPKLTSDRWLDAENLQLALAVLVTDGLVDGAVDLGEHVEQFAGALPTDGVGVGALRLDGHMKVRVAQNLATPLFAVTMAQEPGVPVFREVRPHFVHPAFYIRLGVDVVLKNQG
ncbi:hypothetical protein BC936DRAFT_150051, partial [Jimgerdemannia flammicorona]